VIEHDADKLNGTAPLLRETARSDAKNEEKEGTLIGANQKKEKNE